MQEIAEAPAPDTTIFTFSIFFSAISSVNFVISLIDLSFALMAIPNMISVIYLSKLVKQEITKTDPLEVL